MTATIHPRNPSMSRTTPPSIAPAGFLASPATAFTARRRRLAPAISALLLPSLVWLAACERTGADVARLPPTSATPATAIKPGPAPAAPASAPTAAAPTTTAPATETGATTATIPPPPPGSAFLSGQTEAHRRSTLTPKVSSAVTRVHVRDGDYVKVGQALVTLDTQDFALRTQQAEAGLAAAKVQLDAARLDWNRTKALLDDKAVPQSQFDMVDARLKGAQAGVAQAEASVALGRKALRDATVHAPFNGIIVKRLVNEGEYATVMPATPMVIIEEIDPLDLRIQVPSTEMTKVKVGDTVHVRFPATGQSLDARLSRVVAAQDPRTRTFSAIAELANKDHALRSGLYAEVTLGGPAAAPEPGAAQGKPAKPAAKPVAKPPARPAAKPVIKPASPSTTKD
jgi:RND family efflux transporter MFP subunit